MKQKIIITAANGFIGSALVNFFKGNYDIIGLVRHPMSNSENVTYLLWDGKTLDKWSEAFEGAVAVINLAGRSVDCRYNEKNKHDILYSRLESTQVIADAIKQCKVKPEVWLNAASATIYRFSYDYPMTEKDSDKYGTGFSVDVCHQWEGKFYENKIENVRQVAMRTTIVLGKNGGVMKPFTMLTKLGLGGNQGNGKQQFSWMHIEDFCRAVEFLIDNKSSNGSYNMASPFPITNAHLMKTFRQILKMPFGLPAYEWMLEIGARIIKTETELILKSRYVIPERLMNEGFEFKFPTIEKALEEIIND